ncbi:MAG: zinc-binding alcohol dehydrogenase family protein [Planctomycetota bacterium]
MKVMRINEPGISEVVEREMPTCGEAEVLLRVRRVGYCGSDLNTFRGGNPLVTYPRVPGHELAAEVVEVGPAVPDGIGVGERVTVFPYTECGTCSACLAGRPNCCKFNQTLGVQRDGGLAEYLVVPWEAVVKAEPLGLSGLALIEPLAVGFHAVERGRVTPADTVCVFGCGMIGLGAIAGAARLHNARVIAVDLSDAKLELAQAAGATYAINATNEGLHQELEELTGGHGPDVMIEAVGLPETFRSCVEEVKFAGRVVYIGYAKVPVEYDTKTFILKEIDIMGSRNATREDFGRVAEVLRAGTLPVSRIITSTVSLEAAPGALAEWARMPQASTKIHVDLETQ